MRHCNRLFVTGANLSVPMFMVVLRKAYGLGAQAMAGGSFKEPFFVVAWPTGEFGGMGLEGQVKLGFRNELAAIDDPDARRARYDELVAAAYERGKAIQAGVVVRGRRRDRPGRLAALRRQRARLGPAAAARARARSGRSSTSGEPPTSARPTSDVFRSQVRPWRRPAMAWAWTARPGAW